MFGYIVHTASVNAVLMPAIFSSKNLSSATMNIYGHALWTADQVAADKLFYSIAKAMPGAPLVLKIVSTVTCSL